MTLVDAVIIYTCQRTLYVNLYVQTVLSPIELLKSYLYAPFVLPGFFQG
jgi:hypothetical protein